MSNHLRDVTEKYEAELDRLRAEIRYRDATIRDQAQRIRELEALLISAPGHKPERLTADRGAA